MARNDRLAAGSACAVQASDPSDRGPGISCLTSVAHRTRRPFAVSNLAGSWLMVTKKIAELNASDLDRLARYRSTHAQWDIHVSGPLLAIHHLPNETRLTIGIGVVSISRE